MFVSLSPISLSPSLSHAIHGFICEHKPAVKPFYCWVAKPSRNLGFISWVFLLFFSVSGKVLPVTPLLSGVFVHRVFCAYFVRFEGAGVMRSLLCTINL